MGIIDTLVGVGAAIAKASRKGLTNRRTPVIHAAPHPAEASGYCILALPTSEIIKKRRKPLRFHVRTNISSPVTVTWTQDPAEARLYETRGEVVRSVEALVLMGQGRAL
jgi:hypothetical protein